METAQIAGLAAVGVLTVCTGGAGLAAAPLIMGAASQMGPEAPAGGDAPTAESETGEPAGPTSNSNASSSSDASIRQGFRNQGGRTSIANFTVNNNKSQHTKTTTLGKKGSTVSGTGGGVGATLDATNDLSRSGGGDEDGGAGGGGGLPIALILAVLAVIAMVVLALVLGG